MLKLISAIDATYESILDYYNEFSDKNDINNYAITLIKEGYKRYIDYALTYEVSEINHMYYLIDTDKPDYLIGYCSVETSPYLNFHEEFLNDGAVGYGIRPLERNKGYGKNILSLLIDECVRLNLSEICISCHEHNISSKNIIESQNGRLEKKFLDFDDGLVGLKYWIDLAPLYTQKKTL